MVCHRVESQLSLALLEIMVVEGLVTAVLCQKFAVLCEGLLVHMDPAVIRELVLSRLLLRHERRRERTLFDFLGLILISLLLVLVPVLQAVLYHGGKRPGT